LEAQKAIYDSETVLILYESNRQLLSKELNEKLSELKPFKDFEYENEQQRTPTLRYGFNDNNDTDENNNNKKSNILFK
jgi:hypothetical protein